MDLLGDQDGMGTLSHAVDRLLCMTMACSLAALAAVRYHRPDCLSCSAHSAAEAVECTSACTSCPPNHLRCSAAQPLETDPAHYSLLRMQVSQYLENYLWPNFDPDTSSAAHALSIAALVAEKARENVPAWTCFADRPPEVFAGLFSRLLAIKAERTLSAHESVTYLLFIIHAFQSLENTLVWGQVKALVWLPLWMALSPGRRKVSPCHQDAGIMMCALLPAVGGSPLPPWAHVASSLGCQPIALQMHVCIMPHCPLKADSDAHSDGCSDGAAPAPRPGQEVAGSGEAGGEAGQGRRVIRRTLHTPGQPARCHLHPLPAGWFSGGVASCSAQACRDRIEPAQTWQASSVAAALPH